jgi:hypothetical protein
MIVFASRNFVSWVMIMLFPLSLQAADTGSAIVHRDGGVRVNGAEVSDSTTVFAGDLLETEPGFLANLETEGSSVLIQGESVVKFQGNYFASGARNCLGGNFDMSVQVNCIKWNLWPKTRHKTTGRNTYVTDLSGTVQVATRKNHVTIRQGGTLHKTSSENNLSNPPSCMKDSAQRARNR